MNSFLTTAFLNFAGPVTFLAFILWAYSIFSLSKIHWAKNQREWGISGLWALAAASVAFLSTAVDFKVLSDETNLLSVANMLTLFGKASNTEMWLYYYHTFHALDVSVPSRPILFPVLTALVQSVVGLKSWSPFVVNFFCLVGLFFLTLEWGRRRLSHLARPTVSLALLMSPVLLIVATSAGFDLCSLFFGFLSFLLLGRFLEKKEEAVEQALYFSLVCFASVRYESIVALPLVAGWVWWQDRGRPPPWKLFALLVPLLWPLFVQRYLTWGSFENPADKAPFSLLHLREHAPIFLRSFFIDGRGPYPILLHWLGAFGLLWFLRRAKISSLLPLGYGFFLSVLLLAHHFGFADHPTQVRLFLPLSFGLSALGLFFLAEMKPDPRAILGVFAILFFHHHQYSVHDPLMTQLTMTREVRHLRDFLAEETKGRGDLFVYDRPGQLVALGHSAVSWKYWEDNKAGLLQNLSNHLYQRIFLLEKVRYTGLGFQGSLEKEGYRLVPAREHQLTPEERLRISLVELKKP
jgi:hypothetical protein